MYPTMMVVLVETQRPMADICELGWPNATKVADQWHLNIALQL